MRRTRPRAVAWAPALVGLMACARATPTRTPDGEAAPVEAVVSDEPPEDDVGEPVDAEPRRHGQRVVVDPPPSPPRDSVDVWGDTKGTPVREAFGVGGLGCPPGQTGPATARGGRRSLVELRTVTAEGGLTQALAATILGGRAANLRTCHLEAMAKDPALAGSLRLRLEIRPTGSVGEAVIVDTEVGLDTCALATARAWQFPPADAGSTLDVTFALRTEPAPRGRPRCP